METVVSEDSASAILIERFVRILGACGLSSDAIVAQVSASVPQLEAMAVPNSIFTSDGAHLRACQVVFTWRRDIRFLTAAGTPAVLGRAGASQAFDDLVSLVLPGHDPDDVLDYLQKLHAVDVSDGEVRLLVDSLLTSAVGDGRTLVPAAILSHVNNFLRSVEFNLLEKPNNSKGRFERACYVSVPANLVPIFERFVEARGQDFVDVVDEWLERHRAKTALAVPRCMVGAGAYMFVHPAEVPVP